VVDRVVIHGEPLEFRELCRHAVPEDTRYLILDLDRTAHLGRNMGELLGWELVAYRAYGPRRLAELERRRPPGRFLLDWPRPAALLRYLAVGARMWAFPGLYYLACWKLAGEAELTRRLVFRHFGPDPVAAIQRLPQTALMHQMAAIPSSELRVLARRVWERHQGDQVIERSDLDWLRSRCPRIRIVIASASPQPTLEVAAAELGADDIAFSSLEEHAGYFSAPFRFPRLVLRDRHPRRLSGPSQLRINSSRQKITTLFARYPDLADPDVVSVGVSDTGYGEDHCWVEYFSRVVDINSSAPFPPIVPASSPLREIHSAAVLTRTERARRSAGETAYLDPRRPSRPDRHRALEAAQLSRQLAPLAGEVEQLARRFEERATGLAEGRTRLLRQVDTVLRRIEEIVGAFNEATGQSRRAVLRQLRRAVRSEEALRHQLTLLERPLSDVACTRYRLLTSAREALEGLPPDD